jgi:hypothetical protein
MNTTIIEKRTSPYACPSRQKLDNVFYLSRVDILKLLELAIPPFNKIPCE